MTSPALPFRSALRRPSYARARLLLGITGVGTAVLAAIAMLAFDVSSRYLSSSATQPFVAALATLGIVFACTQLAFLPFDMIGGALLVRRREWASVWFGRWARGAAVQWSLWMIAAAVLMTAARVSASRVATWRVGDDQAVLPVLGAFVVLQVALAMLRGRLARVVSALPVQYLSDTVRHAAERAGLDPRRLTVVDSGDEGFVGGCAGLRGRQLLVPLRWTQLPTLAFAAALARRRIIADSGVHLRGVLGAITWNTLGFAVVLSRTNAAPGTAAGLVTIAAAMTLWAFVGVLLLPTLSRAAVFAVDRDAARRVGVRDVAQAIELLDRWQDDEPSRSRIVETIFHPVPSRTARLRRLSSAQGTGVRWWHTHHIARHALWLSWASFTPLSRLVHCNVGRTALWVMLPGD